MTQSNKLLRLHKTLNKKHVKGQTAKGDKNIIKSTEAPVKDKEVKDGEGKKSVKTEVTVTRRKKMIKRKVLWTWHSQLLKVKLFQK